MLYRTQTKGYGSYNFTTNTSTVLNVAPNPWPFNDTSINLPITIANTSNKMWVYAAGSNSLEVNLRESNIVLSPFTSTFNRNITLPSGFKPGNGLFALNNTTLVGTRLDSVNNSFDSIVELNISNNVATYTTKCTLPKYERSIGGLIVTSGANPKLIVLVSNSWLFGTPYSYYAILQFDYTTGALEFRKIISPTVTVPSGLAEINGNIYIVGYNVYKIDTVAPYNLTLVQTTGIQLINTSQLASCIDTKFSIPNCDCDVSILSQTNILTYNGVTIVPSYVGPAPNYPNGVYPQPDTACTGTDVVATPAGTIILGQYANNATGPFTYTLTFSQPVNNIKLVLTGMGIFDNPALETFTFTTSNGIPTLTSCKGCFNTINGNTVSTDGGFTNSLFIGKGGQLTVTRPTSYTTLTISGPGGLLGTIFAICANSIVPVPGGSPSPSPTPSKTPTPTPSASPPSSNTLGCVYYNFGGYLHNYNPLTNTAGPQIQLLNQANNVNSQNDTHTSNRSWKVGFTLAPGTSDTFTSIFFQEWRTANNPLALTSNRIITLPLSYGAPFTSFAIDNDTMLVLFSNNFTTTTTNFITSTVHRINIVNNTITSAQITPLFTVGAVNQNTLGFANMLLTTTNKLLFVGTRSVNNVTVADIYQYSYPNGVLEGIIPIPQLIPNFYFSEFDLFESNGNIFLAFLNQNNNLNTTIYQINPNPPYNFTLIGPLQNPPNGNPGVIIQGLNSSLNCNTVHFNIPSTCCPTEYSAPQIGSTVVINGITIGGSGNGSILSFTEPSYTVSCFSNPTSALNTIELGDNNPPFTDNPSFTYTMTFSQPVNNFKVKLESINSTETFTFTTNNGTPSLTGCSNCCTTINGNVISANLSDPSCQGYLQPNANGSGYFGISNALPFTTLTISGPGGGGGTILKLCDIGPLTPQPSPTPTPSPSAPSSAFRTIYKYLDIQLT